MPLESTDRGEQDVSNLKLKPLTLKQFAELLHLPENKIPKSFRDCCKEITALVDEERIAQGKAIINHDERVVLINEMYRTYLEHQGRARHDGSGYFEDHLCGATKLLIELEGMVGLSTLLAVLKHDNVEDLIDNEKLVKAKDEAEKDFDERFGDDEDRLTSEGEARKSRFVDKAVERAKNEEEKRLVGELVDLEKYRNELQGGVPDDRLQEIVLTVQTLVRGVTKFRKAKKESTAEATFKRLLEVAIDAIRAIYVKLADRAHNTKTISGHENKITQERIMEETEVQYLSLARILRIRKMVEFFVEECCGFFNPELLEKFNNFASERRSSLGSAQRGRIKNNIMTIGYDRDLRFKFDGFKFSPLDLSNYVGYVDKSFSEMTFEDLKISPFDPMEEILIEVKLDDPKNRSAALVKAALLLEGKFASSEKSEFTRNMAPAGDPDNIMGMRAVCYHPTFGHLRFRINDNISEARSKRGVLAEANSRNTPDDVREQIHAILNRTLRGFHGPAGLKALAREELLQSRITVMTPDGERIHLPRNSTGLDFAAAVHGDLLIRMNKLKVLSNMTSMTEAREVDPFDSLEPDKVYMVDANDRKEDSRVVPEWLLFTNTTASASIRNHFVKMHDLEIKGIEYLRRLSVLFNIDYEHLSEVLARKYDKKEQQDIYRDVGRGLINPVSVLSEYLEYRNNRWKKNIENWKRWKDLRIQGVDEDEINKQKSEVLADISKWEVEVQVPEEAGSLNAFSSEFTSEVGIKIDRIVEHERGVDGNPGKLILLFDLDDNEIDIYDFFVKLVKVNFKYSARITSPIVNKLADLKANIGGEDGDETAAEDTKNI